MRINLSDQRAICNQFTLSEFPWDFKKSRRIFINNKHIEVGVRKITLKTFIETIKLFFENDFRI